MRLHDYLTSENISVAAFADKIGVTPECVRLYVVGERVPGRQNMGAIQKETEGRVMANDFFNAAA